MANNKKTWSEGSKLDCSRVYTTYSMSVCVCVCILSGSHAVIMVAVTQFYWCSTDETNRSNENWKICCRIAWLRMGIDNFRALFNVASNAANHERYIGSSCWTDSASKGQIDALGFMGASNICLRLWVDCYIHSHTHTHGQSYSMLWQKMCIFIETKQNVSTRPNSPHMHGYTIFAQHECDVSESAMKPCDRRIDIGK